jgi:hypothetical protein
VAQADKKEPAVSEPKRRSRKKVEVQQQQFQQSMQLTEVEVLKLRLFMTEQERHARQKVISSIQRAAYLKQIDPQDILGQFDKEFAATDAANELAKKQYQAIIEAVESRLQLKLTDYSFDSDTGLLHKVEQST